MGYMEAERKENDGGGWWWILWAVLIIITGAVILMVPNFLRARASGQYIQCYTNCKNIAVALKIYADNNDENYPASLTALTPDYIQDIPTCASSKTNQGYINSYQVRNDYQVYTFYCAGKNHKRGVGREKNYPQYNSTEGLVN